ncbi:MAG: D-alanyl-D-alanine carboxypeptidase/D-alanyl-D-alanine-endopeptidase [Deltaproteobacteria bacterium]|nr:D-alanyl-D-alanine carboxypeptidase/D-alanyl-D-alanine-endopeptidase [Deltaproteobacteria bacterium]
MKLTPSHNLSLKKAIESALPPGKHPRLLSGIVVGSLTRNEVLYERNADKLLIPASVNKIFTAFAALRKLKPTGTFKTYLYAKGPVREGQLQGDLYIKGGGDPSLVSERMWMLVNELIRWDVKKITGDIIGDASYFDEEKTPLTRPKYLKDQAYNAPVGALSFNFNTTTVYVRAGEKIGEPPRVHTDPQNSYIDVINHGTTKGAGTKNSIVVSRTDFVKGDIGDTVLLRGSIPLDAPEMRFYRNIVNPTLYAGHMFKNFLEQRGIQVQGRVKEGRVPETAKLLVEFDSLPLWQLIWGMNKFSNNFVADQILKKLGAHMWGEPGTLIKGITAVEDVLEDVGIKKKSYEIFDGSGLTRDTLVTARQVLTVLTNAWQDFSISAEFVASLGIAGEDGTIRRRFPNASVPAIRAKTGSLDGVTSLAGFATSADNEPLAFAIILNDPAMKYGKMTAWVDAIAVALTKFSRKF